MATSYSLYSVSSNAVGFWKSISVASSIEPRVFQYLLIKTRTDKSTFSQILTRRSFGHTFA